MRSLSGVDIAKYIVLSIFVVAVIYPFYNLLLVSVTPKLQYIKEPFMLYPKEISLGSYQYIFDNARLLRGFIVTTIVTIVGTFYNITLTLSFAYALNHRFPGKNILLVFVMIPLFFDGGLVPQYLLIKNLGFMDSIFAMILPTGINLIFLFTMCKMLKSIPYELEEASRLDGANDLQILFRVYLPIAKPIIAAFALYYAVERWNEWYLGMLYIHSDIHRPLQLIVKNIVANASSFRMSERMNMLGILPFDDGIKMACVVITVLPIIFLYPLLQKYFLTGLSEGAIKE